MIIYLNGEFIPREEAQISPEDRGFLFADGVYEVIRSYGGKLFQEDAHLRRLDHSLRSLRLQFADVEALKPVLHRLITDNGLTTGQALVYLQITRGAAPRLHAFPPSGTPPTVYATASALVPHREEQEQGIGVITVPDIRWARCDIKSIALLPNVLARQRAAEAGAEEAIFVREGVALEGATSNFFAVLGGAVVTAPKSNYLLGGITREVVIELCRRLGIILQEAPVFEEELTKAQELFITSTRAEVTPVVRLNGRPVGTGGPGPITRRLQEAFRNLLADLQRQP